MFFIIYYNLFVFLSALSSRNDQTSYFSTLSESHTQFESSTLSLDLRDFGLFLFFLINFFLMIENRNGLGLIFFFFVRIIG